MADSEKYCIFAPDYSPKLKKDMKKYLIALCLVCSMTAFAQEGRNDRVTIGMNNLNYTVKEQKKDVGTILSAIADALVGESTTEQASYQDAVRATIVKGLSQSHRVSVIDGRLSEEEAARPSSCYIDGTVSNISTTKKTELSSDKKNTYTYYKALIGLTLHIKNAQNDEVIASPAFNITDTDMSWVKSADGAIVSALERLSSRITSYFNRWLPLKANIIEGAREKKDKQKEVYIDLGSSEGAYKGLHFGVFTVKTVAGKEAKRQIGKLKIEEVMGDDISICKVQSGGKDIKAAIDAGENLLVITTD